MYIHIGVSKNTGKHPKMDGENNEKPYEQMDDLGGYPPIFGNIHMGVSWNGYLAYLRLAKNSLRALWVDRGILHVNPLNLFNF